jgi:hypothetical protein
MKYCLISKNGMHMIGTDIVPLHQDQAWVAQAVFMILSRSSARFLAQVGAEQESLEIS